MSPPHPSSGYAHHSWPKTVAYSTATWGGGMSVAPQLIEGGEHNRSIAVFIPTLNGLAYVPALATLGSELRRTRERRSSQNPSSTRSAASFYQMPCRFRVTYPRKDKRNWIHVSRTAIYERCRAV